MFFERFLLISTFFSIIWSDPRKYYLQQFDPATPHLITDIEVGAKLFLSSKDFVERLQNIKLRSGNVTITADQLSSNKNADGSQKWLIVEKDGLTIESTNSKIETQSLYGVLYSSTARQAADPNFIVFVIKDKITVDRKNNQNSTIVLLGPIQVADISAPTSNVYIDNIEQSKTASLIAFRNFPTDDYQNLANNCTIFRNPLKFRWDNNATTEIFFSKTDDLQFPIDAFYMIVNGGISFQASDQWKDRTVLTSSALTTTGLILNSGEVPFSKVTFMNNTNKLQTMGTIINANVEYDLRVSMILQNSTIYQVFEKGHPVYNQIKYVDSHINALLVDPQTSAVSDYSVQYFSIDGMAFPIESTTTIPSTQTSTTKSETVMTTMQTYTTTRGAAKLSSFITLIFLLIHFYA